MHEHGQMLDVVAAIENLDVDTKSVLDGVKSIAELKWLLQTLSRVYKYQPEITAKPLLITRESLVNEIVNIFGSVGCGLTAQQGIEPHLITPEQHCINLRLIPKNIGPIRQILRKLYLDARASELLVVEVDNEKFDLKKDIVFGRRVERSKYTYFSHHKLGKYLLEALEKLEMPPKETELVSLSVFCTDYFISVAAKRL